MAQVARNDNRFLANQVIQVCSSGGRLLDYGAGLGTLADLLRERGHSVDCLERDDTLRARLAEKGYAVFHTISQVEVGSVDTIIAFNVLEHIVDDQMALCELWQRLRPGGRMVVFVPALLGLYSSMDWKVGHVRRYTRGELACRLIGAGFRIESIRYVDSLGVIATLIYKLIGNRGGDLNRLALWAYDRLVFPLSVYCDLLFWWIAGKNLLVTARRPAGGPS